MEAVNAGLKGTTLGASTDRDGEFSILNVPAGEYTLVISSIGFEKQEMNITIESGKTLTIEIRLEKTTCLLYTSPSPRDQRGSRMPSSA